MKRMFKSVYIVSTVFPETITISIYVCVTYQTWANILMSYMLY